MYLHAELAVLLEILCSVLDAMICTWHWEEFHHFLIMLKDPKINKTETSKNGPILISQDEQEKELENY